jgi:hypothetical protein
LRHRFLRSAISELRGFRRLDAVPSGNPTRPRYVHIRTFRRLIAALTAIEHAITGKRLSKVRAHYRYRTRDLAGRYITTATATGERIMRSNFGWGIKLGQRGNNGPNPDWKLTHPDPQCH